MLKFSPSPTLYSETRVSPAEAIPFCLNNELRQLSSSLYVLARILTRDSQAPSHCFNESLIVSYKLLLSTKSSGRGNLKYRERVNW